MNIDDVKTMATDFMYDQKRSAKSIMRAIEENTNYFNLDDNEKNAVRKTVMRECNSLYRKFLLILRAIGFDLIFKKKEGHNGQDVE